MLKMSVAAHRIEWSEGDNNHGYSNEELPISIVENQNDADRANFYWLLIKRN